MENNSVPNRKAGGFARADILTKQQREEISRKAAVARWHTDLPKVICGAPDKPLRIGQIEIPCYVLEGEKRVLVQRAIVSAIGMARGGSSKGGGDRLSHFVNQNLLKPFISDDLRAVTAEPIKFIAPNGSIAHGYEAEFLAKLCFAVMDAEREGKLQEQQKHIARQCRILIEGFSVVGINALVDEATGYQEIRDKHALRDLLDKYLLKELAAWAKRFPDEFYKQIFRLRGWEWNGMKVNRPSCVGTYTNDLVYERLAPGILDELKRRMPKHESGARKGLLQQLLTEDVGHPALQAHLAGLMALQRATADGQWDHFKRMVDRAFPKFNVTIPLALGDA